jgi:hypothetical protein
MTTTARMTRFGSRLAPRRPIGLSDIFAAMAFAAAVAFSAALVFGLIG